MVWQVVVTNRQLDALTVARSAHSAAVQLGTCRALQGGSPGLVQEHGEALYLLSGSLLSVDSPHPKTHVTETSGAGDFVDLNLLSAFKHVWGFLNQTVADTPGASCIGLLNATRHVLIAPGP